MYALDVWRISDLLHPSEITMINPSPGNGFCDIWIRVNGKRTHLFQVKKSWKDDKIIDHGIFTLFQNEGLFNFLNKKMHNK